MSGSLRIPPSVSSISSIPPKILETNADLFYFPLVELFNRLVQEGSFPNDLKCADVLTLFKKGDTMCTEIYKPINLLPAISKLFERLLYTQLYDYMRQFFSPLLGGFRQGYSTQHVLLNFLQRCKSSIDNNGLAGALFMDLSKALDSVDHNLLLAKLNAYGINLDALQLLRSYLSKKYQRVKVNSTFSGWKEISFGVPRGSVLGLYFLMYL